MARIAATAGVSKETLYIGLLSTQKLKNLKGQQGEIIKNVACERIGGEERAS
jgi:hypothetical protein